MRALIRITMLASILLAASVEARAPERRDIAALRWNGEAKTQAVRDGRWVLIVVDARRRSGEMLLDELRRSGYEGRDALVLVVGDAATAPAYARRTGLLREAHWQWAPVDATLRDLDLAGTPVVLGIDAGTRIAWQESGTPRRAGDLAVRIADWINHDNSTDNKKP